MPRIDPLSLLKCLSVLLGPAGGIKSKEEVNRLANLMTKFSKKLVSKCIYIQILKVTNSELLSQFMAADGWKLIHSWLQDGIAAKNWELVQELLELLLLCPVDIERLKSNNCPKMVKGLSKEGQPIVKALASRLVEQWLKIVKGEAPPNSVPIQIAAAAAPSLALAPQASALVTSNPNQVQMMDVAEPESCDIQQASTIQVQDLEVNNITAPVHDNLISQPQPAKFQEQIHLQPVQLQIVNKTIPGQSQPTQIKKQSFVVVTTTANHHNHHAPTVPVYKITIRDGKQVLTKVETDSANIKNLLIRNDESVKNMDTTDVHEDSINKNENSVAVVDDCRTLKSDHVLEKVSGEVIEDKCNNFNNQVDNVVLKMDNVIIKTDNNENQGDNDVKDIINSDGNNKSSDKENLDAHKKDDKSISSSSSSSNSSDKKNSTSSSHHSSRSSSKHSSSSSNSRSNSHKSSHRSSSSKSSSKSSSSRDKDRHHSSKHSSSSSSSKSRSDRDKEREKEKEKIKKDQAEKDKATLEKIQGQGSLGTKFGKIPKKKPEDETNDSLRKSSTDSRDSSKENKDSKKISGSGSGVLEKKNISISIENRKNSQDIQRPKTVKTFNSKFRSTGLEEEIKPPPPRTAGKKNSTSSISTTITSTDKKISSPKVQSLKRSSPLRETGASADKKIKLSLDTPSTPPLEDKKGAIKLIPPKPKPMVLQESDMFMDALMTASTKNKEPRKRKRRTSISKDCDAKKTDGSNSSDAASRDATSPPLSSPQGGDDRSALPKPEFKFYQDTLETDEDKDDESTEEKTKDRTDEDEDDRSRTPTCDDEDSKAPASPDNLADAGRKEVTSPNDEIRYVDGLRSVLLLQKRKGPKKNLKWRTELESVRYFELDETERVNVTKTFTDMKQMEKKDERRIFQARKLTNLDTMVEKTRWTTLIPIDLPAPLVEPGKDSREKEIQYAREKGILQALYFDENIPDSPAEPDEERHHIMADPKVIPLDDLTGNKESEKDFTSVPWPEPKPQLPPVAPIVQNIHFPTFPQHNPTIPGLPLPSGSLGISNMPQQMPQQMPQPLMPPINHMPGGVQDVGGGGWRTGDGKVVVPDVSMNMPANLPTNFPPPNIDPSMMPPNMIGPPGMYNQPDAYQGMTPNDDGNFGHMSNNFQGPAMFGPGNFQPLPPRGAQMNPMHGGNRGRGGPGWFRGNIAPMRGGWNNRGAGVGGNVGGGWRNNAKQPPICRQFTKTGYCRIGDKCQYLHPGVNYPPF